VKRRRGGRDLAEVVVVVAGDAGRGRGSGRASLGVVRRSAEADEIVAAAFAGLFLRSARWTSR
jgi:hypothetical protein